jgi:hypothetical protein
MFDQVTVTHKFVGKITTHVRRRKVDFYERADIWCNESDASSRTQDSKGFPEREPSLIKPKMFDNIIAKDEIKAVVVHGPRFGYIEEVWATPTDVRNDPVLSPTAPSAKLETICIRTTVQCATKAHPPKRSIKKIQSRRHNGAQIRHKRSLVVENLRIVPRVNFRFTQSVFTARLYAGQENV